MNVDFDKLLVGSIDMHLHAGPDIMPCCVDALEAAKQAKRAGMRAIVLKSHTYPSAPLATIVNQLIPEVEVFGAICLDYEIGGLNPFALENSARLGARVVWMPTTSSSNSRAKMRALGIPLEGDGFSILDAKAQLLPEIGHILSLVKEYDMVLANGHLSPPETFALVDEARKMGIWKLVITHPADVEFVDQALSMEDQQRLVQMGAFIEHTVVSLLPTQFGHNVSDRVEMIKAVGAERCIMSTDLGLSHDPSPAEGMRMFMAALLGKGVTQEEIGIMAKVNPARLLGLD